MENLKDIVKEIEEEADLYNLNGVELRKSINQYVQLVILEAPKSEQYNLCYYWDKLIR